MWRTAACTGKSTHVEPDFDLDALVDGFRRKGFAFAFRMVGNADDAADAVQEALSVLWARRHDIRRGQDPAAWFFRVLRNHCVDQLRKCRLRRYEPVDAANLPDARTDRPDALAEHHEFDARLAEELERLDPAYREILLLRDYQNLSYAQIAEVLAIRQGTVMSRLHRARMILRERLKGFL